MSLPKLTQENYFSPESNRAYMSVSQYKSFCNCEARTLAELNQEWIRETTIALLVGSYVDAYFEGRLDSFVLEHPEVLTRTGNSKAEFAHAQYIIERIKRDKLFMSLLSGEKQVIKTGEIDGIPFKTKIDSYLPGKAIVDLKIMKDFHPIYQEGKGRLSFIEAWGYDIQGAVYQYIEGNQLPFYIAAATKEKEPDIGVWQIDQNELDICMELLKGKIKRFALLKEGIGEPARCEKCDYCKSTKILTTIYKSEELNYE